MSERLPKLVSFEGLKLAAGAVRLAPYTPLLFMGEEYCEELPFLDFVRHSDPDLVAAVREGRKAEFQEFQQKGETPDPPGHETFLQSGLRWDKRREGRHKVLFEFYRRLIRLRKGIHAISNPDRKNIEVFCMEKIFDSSDELWDGSGSSLPGMIEPGPGLTIRPLGFVLYEAYT